mgnify:CR=1 FL=1
MKTALLNHSRDTENENVCVDEDGSKKRGEESLQWMINPMKIKRFMKLAKLTFCTIHFTVLGQSHWSPADDIRISTQSHRMKKNQPIS